MKLNLFQTSDCLNTLSHGWDELLERSSHQTPFYTYGFCRSWYQSYSSESPFIATITDHNNTLILIAPLVNCKDGWLRIAGYKRGDYNAILYDQKRPDAFHYLLRTLIKRGYKMELTNQHQLDTTFSLLQNPFDRSKHKWFRYQLLRAGSLYPFSVIKSHRDCPYIDQHQKETVTRKIQSSKSHQQRIKQLSKLGELSYRYTHNKEQITQLLPTLFQLHITEWENSDSPSLFTNPEHTFFYHQLAQNLSANSLRLDMLYLGNRIIAMHFGFEDDQTLYYYKPCYDITLRKNSPGNVLLNYIVTETLESGKNFDFLKGAESYKNYYSDEFSVLRHLKIEPSMITRLIPALCK